MHKSGLMHIWKPDFLPKGLYTDFSFSCFYNGLCQWRRVNADAVQAPSVFWEDLNSGHLHKTHLWESDSGCPGAMGPADRKHSSIAVWAAEIV